MSHDDTFSLRPVRMPNGKTVYVTQEQFEDAFIASEYVVPYEPEVVTIPHSNHLTD